MATALAAALAPATAGIGTFAELPATSGPSAQVTTWPAAVQPAGSVPGVTPAGRVSADAGGRLEVAGRVGHRGGVGDRVGAAARCTKVGRDGEGRGPVRVRLQHRGRDRAAQAAPR